MHTNDLYVAKSYMEQKPDQESDHKEKIAMEMNEINMAKNKKEKKLSLFGVVRNALMGRPIPSDQNPFIIQGSNKSCTPMTSASM